MGGAGVGGDGVTPGGFEAACVAGTPATGGFDSGDFAATLTAGAVEGGRLTGAVTMGGRTGAFCASVVAGGADRAGDCGDRNHAISAMSRMASSATCAIARARRGLSDL
jgi:hypothetical protein